MVRSISLASELRNNVRFVVNALVGFESDVAPVLSLWTEEEE